MKRIIIAMFAAVIALEGSAQKNFKDLIGHWEVVGDKNTQATLEVKDSATILLSYNGEKKTVLNYKIDFNKSPIWFDFSTDDSTASIVTIKSLMEIMNDNMIKWQLFVDEERTDHFSSTKGELFYLRKSRPVISTAAVSN